MAPFSLMRFHPLGTTTAPQSNGDNEFMSSSSTTPSDNTSVLYVEPSDTSIVDMFESPLLEAAGDTVCTRGGWDTNAFEGGVLEGFLAGVLVWVVVAVTGICVVVESSNPVV